MERGRATGGVAGLVLAAGGSRRWGEGSKLLAPWDDGRLVQAAVEAAREAGLDPVVVVLGDRADEVSDVLPDGVETVRHAGWRRGRASSLAAGIRALADREEVAAAAVFLGDQPRLPPSAVRAVLDAWREDTADAVRPFYGDVPGHPVVFGRRCFPELAALDGEEGVRRYLDEESARVRTLRLDLPAPPDVDTPDDLRRLREAPEGGTSGGSGGRGSGTRGDPDGRNAPTPTSPSPRTE